MNTEPDSKPSDLIGLVQEQDDAPSDDALARIEQENAALRDAIREERFLWILACTILFDMIVFENMRTTGAPIAVVVLELGFFVVVARRLGVDEIIRLVDRAIDGWSKRDK